MAVAFAVFVLVSVHGYPAGILYAKADLGSAVSWHPVCGQSFWMNNQGADIACRQMGYTHGNLLNGANDAEVLPMDAISIGRCKFCEGHCI